jgi:UDP-N-acetylmuramyl tripeptide synthase
MLLEEVMLKVVPGGLPGGSCAHRGLEVRGLTPDLRRVSPGTVFVALPDRSIADPFAAFRAADLGAQAVICEPDTPLPRGVTRIEVPDTRRAFAQAASAFFGHPERSLELLAVRSTSLDPGAGTRRFSTNLVHLLARLLGEQDGALPCLSELSCETGGRWLARPVSGLDAFELYEALARSVRSGEPRVLLEAGAALQNDPDLAAHLRWLEPERVEPEVLQGSWKGAVLSLGGVPVSTRLVGRGNWAAVAAAVGLAGREVMDQRILGRVPRLVGTPGFLEPVQAGQSFGVFVDAARTPTELEQMLSEIRSFHRGRVILVIGGIAAAGGEERRALGAAAARADEVVVTADDPEYEPVESLCADVVSGGPVGRFRVEPERARAISQAISRARMGDVVVVAGKAHRNTQMAEGALMPWDDRRTLYAALADRGHGGTCLS